MKDPHPYIGTIWHAANVYAETNWPFTSFWTWVNTSGHLHSLSRNVIDLTSRGSNFRVRTWQMANVICIPCSSWCAEAMLFMQEYVWSRLRHLLGPNSHHVIFHLTSNMRRKHVLEMTFCCACHILEPIGTLRHINRRPQVSP